MKNRISLVIVALLFWTTQLFAQSQNIVVEYKGFFDTNNPTMVKGYLYANSSSYIYEEDESTRKRINEKPKEEEVDKYYFKATTIDNDIYSVDTENHTIETFDWLSSDNKSKITDQAVINWKLINDKKIIDGIECHKATAYFRGRNWNAWYAPSIPYSVGPVKFHGLPGLIIEVSDNTKRYNYTVTKIEYTKDNIYKEQLLKFNKIEHKFKHTLKEFVEAREELIEGFIASSNERGSNIIREKQPRPGMEALYEWEEEK